MTTETHPTVRFLDRPQGRIAYDLTGPDGGPLVLAVPGMGDLRQTWRELTPALAAAGFRVARMDLRGHGDSDTTFDSHDDVAAASDVVALLDALAAPGERALLLGSSMGAGAVTLAAADHPGRVAGLVLSGPFVRSGDLAWPLRLALSVALARPWGPAFWRGYQARLFRSRRPDDLAEHQRRVVASLTRPGAWSALRATTRTSHAPVQARLGDVRVPTLVVMGTADPDWPDPIAEARAVADLLGGAQVLLVEGAGHYPHAERADVVTPAVLALAGRVLGA